MDDAAEELTRAEQLLEAREPAAALTAFHRAEVRGANVGKCVWGRWMASMLGGDFEAAWRESDRILRWESEAAERFWQGEPLAGRRVIVRCLHGLGDTVQMLGYAERLRTVCESVVWEVPPRLADLARCFAGVDRVMTWDDPQPEWDVQVEVMELPHLFRTQLAELPVARNYLEVPGAERARVRGVMGEWRRPRVGVVWTASGWNPARSLPFWLVQELVQVAGFEFWYLGSGEERAAWAELQVGGLRDAAECGEGLMALAGVVAQLDLVITVDTLAAHLAGALGTPAWVLLQHAADWRWMVEREDSPWYPSLRLFRQPTPGDWTGVMERVVGGLLTWPEGGV